MQEDRKLCVCWDKNKPKPSLSGFLNSLAFHSRTHLIRWQTWCMLIPAQLLLDIVGSNGEELFFSSTCWAKTMAVSSFSGHCSTFATIQNTSGANTTARSVWVKYISLIHEAPNPPEARFTFSSCYCWGNLNHKQWQALDQFENMKSMERGTVWTLP